MTKLLGLIVVLALFAAPAAYAQDGSSCANSIPLQSNSSVDVDTTTGTNWNGYYGPAVSPSNDVMYTFTANSAMGSITPTVSDYAFAMYLLTGCTDGDQAAPIGATATIGTGIAVDALTDGTQYWLAVTGTAAGGAGANGTLTFTTPTLPVTLQSFSID